MCVWNNFSILESPLPELFCKLHGKLCFLFEASLISMNCECFGNWKFEGIVHHVLYNLRFFSFLFTLNCLRFCHAANIHCPIIKVIFFEVTNLGCRDLLRSTFSSSQPACILENMQIYLPTRLSVSNYLISYYFFSLQIS